MPVVQDKKRAERYAAEFEEAMRIESVNQQAQAAERREAEAEKAAEDARREADAKRPQIFLPVTLAHGKGLFRSYEPRPFHRFLGWARTQASNPNRIRRFIVWHINQAERVWSYVGVRVRGNAGPEIREARRAKCDECSVKQIYYRLDGTYREFCGPCGCPLSRKIALARSECPLKRWDEPRRTAGMEAKIVAEGLASQKELDLAIAGCGSCGGGK